MERIDWELYLNKLINKQNNGLAKIITGMRRNEKSFLLESIIEIFNANIYNYYASFRKNKVR